MDLVDEKSVTASEYHTLWSKRQSKQVLGGVTSSLPSKEDRIRQAGRAQQVSDETEAQRALVPVSAASRCGKLSGVRGASEGGMSCRERRGFEIQCASCGGSSMSECPAIRAQTRGGAAADGGSFGASMGLPHEGLPRQLLPLLDCFEAT